MKSEETNPLEIESERAYVVYDPNSGAIVHVHRVTTFRGAKKLSPEKEQARAMAMAKQFGHAVKGLRVVPADPRDLDQRLQPQVDLTSLGVVSKRQRSKADRNA